LVKAEVERRAKEDRIGINQLGATAAAEKLVAMDTAALFAERRERADMKTFDRLMRCKRGVLPQTDDRLDRASNDPDLRLTSAVLVVERAQDGAAQPAPDGAGWRIPPALQPAAFE